MPRLNIDLEMRLAQFQDAIGKVEKQVGRVGKNISRSFGDVRNVIRATVAALGVRALASQFDQVTESLDRIGKSAEAFGLTTDELQKLTFAAEQNGVKFEDLSRSLGLLAKNMGDFQKGTGEAKDAFAALRINVEQSPGVLKGTDQVLGEIADKFAGFSDGANKTALAIKLFGESGAKLVPFLNRGASGIDDLKKKAEELGIVIGGDIIRAATEFRDNLAQIERATESLKIRALGPLIKDLAEITSVFGDAATAALDFGEKLKLIFGGTGGSVGRIASLRIEVEKLEASLGKPLAPQSFINDAGVEEFIPSSNEAGQRRLAQLKKQLAEEIKIFDANQQRIQKRAAGAGTSRAGLPAAPALANAQAAKAANDALLALLKSRGDAEVKEETRIAGERLAALQRAYDKGQILEEDYQRTRLEIQKTATDRIVAALDDEVKARQDAVARAPKGSADYFKAVKDLEEALRDRNDAERELSQFALKSYQESEDAAKAYGDEVTRLTAQLLQLQGSTGEAVRLTTELEQADARRRAAQRGDSATLQVLDQIKAATVAQAQFNQARTQGQGILDDLAIAEERIQNSRRVGAITELDSLEQTGAARERSLETLRATADQLSKIARESGLPELMRQAEQFENQLDSLAASTNLLGQKFDAIGQTAFADLITDFTDRTKTAKQAFDDFAKSIVTQVNRIIAENLAQKLQGAIFGDLLGIKGGGGASGFGAGLGKLLQGGFSLFGGGGIGAAAPTALQLSGPFAGGGAFRVGGFGGTDSQTVAFRASPNETVRVTTPDQERSGFGNTTNHITINVPEGTSRASAGQIAAEVGFRIQKFMGKNG